MMLMILLRMNDYNGCYVSIIKLCVVYKYDFVLFLL